MILTNHPLVTEIIFFEILKHFYYTAHILQYIGNDTLPNYRTSTIRYLITELQNAIYCKAYDSSILTYLYILTGADGGYMFGRS